jgi:hypothetical protein
MHLVLTLNDAAIINPNVGGQVQAETPGQRSPTEDWRLTWERNSVRRHLAETGLRTEAARPLQWPGRLTRSLVLDQ